MEKTYADIRSKIETIRSSGSSGLRAVYYGMILGILKYLIILTKNPGAAFVAINQSQGAQSIGYSYKNFKSYQTQIRIIFLLLVLILISALVFLRS